MSLAKLPYISPKYVSHFCAPEASSSRMCRKRGSQSWAGSELPRFWFRNFEHLLLLDPIYHLPLGKRRIRGQFSKFPPPSLRIQMSLWSSWLQAWVHHLISSSRTALDLLQKQVHSVCSVPPEEAPTSIRHVLVPHDSTRSPGQRLILSVVSKLPLRFLAHSGSLLTVTNLLTLPDAHCPCPQGQQVFREPNAHEQKLATLTLFLPESEADRFLKANFVLRAKLATSWKCCLIGDS